MQPSEQFQYRQLQHNPNSIRVLTINFGQETEDIEVTLNEEPLGGTHVCLSYEWGSATETRDIIVNGKAFAIRQNLYAFLLAARRQRLTDSLWIDAVCINQNDDAEKSQQVQLMGRIYSQARYVLVWLGLPNLDLEPLVTVQRLLEGTMPATVVVDSQLHRHWSSCFTSPPWLTWSFAEKFERLSRPPKDTERSPEQPRVENLWITYTRLNKDLHDTLGEIGHSTYFRRAWIVQETILAKSMVLVSESQMISLDPALRFLSELVYEPDQAPSWWRQPSPYEHIHFFFTLKRSLTRLNIQDAFSLSSERGCQDSRDRIYAIRSLISEGQEINVDYTDLVETVFAKVLNWAWKTSLSTAPYGILQALLFTRQVADYAFMNLKMPPPEKSRKVLIEDLCKLDIGERFMWVRLMASEIENISVLALVIPLSCSPRLAVVLPVVPPDILLEFRPYKWVLLTNRLPFMINIDNKRSTPGHRDEKDLKDGELDYLLARDTQAAETYHRLYGNA